MKQLLQRTFYLFIAGLFLWLIKSPFLYCQPPTLFEVRLYGKIANKATNDPLPFINVTTYINKKLRGTQTDFDGNYELRLPPGSYTISYSSVGYVTYSTEVNIPDKGNSNNSINLNAQLEEEKALLETVVVSGSKYAQKLSEQIVSLEVLKPGIIENSNNKQLDEALQKVPGVDVIDDQANIRGGSGFSYGAGSRVMLLMDDLPILTADSGLPFWDFLPIENLSQVEIIKGASSALYGSAAMNGIVNLRTAYPKNTPETKISIFNGIYQKPSGNITNDVAWNADGTAQIDSDGDTVRQQKAWWGNKAPVEAGFSISHRRKIDNLDLVTGAYFLSSDTWRQHDYQRRGRVNANLRYRLPSINGLAIGVNINAMLNRSGTFLIWNRDNTSNGTISKGQPGYVGEAGSYQLWSSTPPINGRGQKLTIDPFVEYFNKSGGRHKLLGRYYRNYNRNDTDQSTLSDILYGEYQYQQQYKNAGLTITAGIVTTQTKANAELYTSDSFPTGKFNASNLAGYLQLDKKLGKRLNASVGGRYERNTIEEETEAKPVLRAGLNYHPLSYTFIRASFGQAYRFPTIAEKYLNTALGSANFANKNVPIGIYPNFNLKSETGWTAEIGIKQGFKVGDWQGFLDVACFRSEYYDMMEFTFGASDPLRKILVATGYWPELDTSVISIPVNFGIGFQSINIGDTRISGIDASIAGEGNLFGFPTTLLAGYTYINPQFQNFNKVERMLSSSDKNVLKYRYRHTAKTDIETKLGKVSIGLSMRYFSFMEAIDQAFNLLIPGVEKYRDEFNDGNFIYDMRLLFHLTNNSTLTLICNNLFNHEYSMRPALIEAPRQFQLKYSLLLTEKTTE
ncbi:MAG: TonB-dependent receptor [Sphingobacteriales bacterium]|nr:TonB-dependent receptor [Sphingobacteriales bacterium]MBP9140441.1 TonB-dependent receptor [Chitinophagales bacterium]MBK6891298.1 TonB-dependent receptor [Sphingobacteriales bacterium]MBK7526872.1 TonB-dependent receptor [Sphingobacteriales bacterium]MBK8677365.1 TonB-dependent receptor [Sphingobacteriales bacterium]